MSLPTTSSPKRGRPRGQPKAERRLARELAGNQLQAEGLRLVEGTAREFLRAANSNPVIGLATGVITVAGLYRLGVLNTFEAGIIYSLLGAEAAADVIESIAKFIPFAPSQSSQNAFQPVASSPSYYDNVPPTPTVQRQIEQAKMGI